MAKKKHHKFTHTHIEHFHDGSAAVHHVHEEGPHKDVKHAVGSLDEAHDSLQDHLGAPNEGEEQANQGQHGIPAEAAQAAGIPAAAASAPTVGA